MVSQLSKTLSTANPMTGTLEAAVQLLRGETVAACERLLGEPMTDNLEILGWLLAVIERKIMDAVGTDSGALPPEEQHDVVPAGGQVIGQFAAQPAGREIGQPANLIEGFVSRSGGHDTAHNLNLVITPRRRNFQNDDGRAGSPSRGNRPRPGTRPRNVVHLLLLAAGGWDILNHCMISAADKLGEMWAGMKSPQLGSPSNPGGRRRGRRAKASDQPGFIRTP